MKMLKLCIATTFLGVSATTLITSCRKEQPLPAATTPSTTPLGQAPNAAKSVENEGATYYLFDAQGNTLPTGYQFDQPDAVAFLKQKDSATVYAWFFDNENQFKTFIMTQPEDSAEVLSRLRKKDVIMSYPGIENEIAMTDSDSDATPSAAFQSWFDDEIKGGSFKTTGTGVLYADECFSGSSYPLLPFPNWGFGRFKNKASSVNFAGVSALYDGTWWRGRSIWVAQSVPSSRCTKDFKPSFWSFRFTINFDDRAESSL